MIAATKKRLRTARQDRAVAYHEAGHAVVAVGLGISIRWVTIAPKCVQRRGEVRLSHEDQEDPLHLAIVGFAGGMAEMRAVGRRRISFCRSDDVLQVQECILRVVIGQAISAGDLSKRSTPDLAKTAQELHSMARGAARKLVVRLWPPIHAVAHALMERRTLRASEIRRIILKGKRPLSGPRIGPSKEGGGNR